MPWNWPATESSQTTRIMLPFVGSACTKRHLDWSGPMLCDRVCESGFATATTPYLRTPCHKPANSPYRWHRKQRQLSDTTCRESENRREEMGTLEKAATSPIGSSTTNSGQLHADEDSIGGTDSPCDCRLLPPGPSGKIQKFVVYSKSFVTSSCVGWRECLPLAELEMCFCALRRSTNRK